MDALAVARAILDCGKDDVLRLLSLAPGLPPVTAETSLEEARRNYIRLASLIHPDILKGRFHRATEAFQKLVQAFERVADPEFRGLLFATKASVGGNSRGATKQKTRPESKKEVITVEEVPQVVRRATAQRVTVKSKERVEKSHLVPVESCSSVRSRKNLHIHDSERHQSEKSGASATCCRKIVRLEPSASVYVVDSVSSADFVECGVADDVATEDKYNYVDSASSDGVYEEQNGSTCTDAKRVAPRCCSLLGDMRSGGIYCGSIISCPQCHARWDPDIKQHYTLFMGPARKKIHCEVCLCRFGCTTALHACPHCRFNFDYDVSMYDKVVRCKGCEKEFAFPRYPVNKRLVDLASLEELQDRAYSENARERRERAERRSRRSSGS
ncbi:hypothetical protein ERJ75_000244000 [Trypanosoma vivax]|uniref:J domain-containing protein n=1 Tax=Trypanosoma vivax (strain Y486) TaxID=1055687 RepID=G0U3V3_TRYVY|nr:hypothetical protein TRVL_05713 [Trypanosoma vivax]KAH8618647.1 hypothetical protein ERJ75_000244000 [Trypanosoma vivax]CCC50193.1 conserved hypothetical protein [Trypanosoma vivax Y486]